MGAGTPLSVEGAIPPLPPVEPQKPRRRRRAWIGAAIAVIMALIVGIVAVSRDGDHETPSGQAATWDPRVQDLVGFVEETRGLTFDHPVPIEFLSEDAFDAEVTSENADLTEEERRSLEGTEASFRALGLIGPHVDLLEALNTLSSGDVAAFYDSEREKVFAPEGETTPTLRATLVHELTHALQDQRFGLDRLQDDDGSDQNSAFRALVEGDAQRIQQAYVAAMSPEDAAAYQEEQKKDNASVTGALKGVPTVLRSLFESSYILGDSFTQVLLADGGQSRIDVAFGEPPTDEAQLLDPLTFLAGEDAIDVPKPPLPAGESEIDSGDFGAISWYLLLATR